MPRLFAGLEIPAEIGQSLSNLRGGLPGARWIDPENYHVTLRFIGDIDGVSANEIASMLVRVNRKPFDVKVQGLTSFGGKKPRAVVAAVEPSRALIELQAEQERLMDTIAGAMQGGPEAIVKRQICHFFRADPAYGEGVAKALGITFPRGIDTVPEQPPMPLLGLVTEEYELLGLFHAITSAVSAVNDFEYPARHWFAHFSSKGIARQSGRNWSERTMSTSRARSSASPSHDAGSMARTRSGD